MLSKVITSFQERRKKKIADNNYTELVEKMINYHRDLKLIPAENVNEINEKEILILAIVDIENKKAAGQIDELNRLRTA